MAVADSSGDASGLVADSPDDLPVVTVHLWRVRPSRVLAAVASVALDPYRARRLAGARFVKLLGTGGGTTFTARDARPTQWAMVASWDSPTALRRAEQSPVLRGWHERSAETWRATLRPLSSRGRWSRREPFDVRASGRWDGPVAAITRARIAPRRAMAFWRSVPPVAADLADRPGLALALGIGEAPVGVQGTFSLWRDGAALRRFAYAGDAHRSVVRRTAEVGWYAEELFARFAVLDTVGSVDGRDPLAAVS